MGKGSSSTTTQSNSSSSTSPDSNAYQAYLQLLQRAQGVASTPYQGYEGEQVAPINEQQRAGIGAINTQQGAITATGAPLSAADIQRYQDPYTQSVIDATQRDFDVQNARQQSQVTGNAAAQGALGGDRSAVAAALAAEGQNRTQAPIIAGLRSQGYQNAVNTAENQQQQALRAGVAGLQGAQAMVGAGTLEQQTQQAQDTQNRLDYYQKQGYPFQVAQWLAQIDTGVGSQMGGTSTSTGTTTKTPPTPNPWSQVAGLGLTAAGMFLRDGGAVSGIHRFADGGTVDFDSWKRRYAPHDSGEDYDLRGAYEAGILPDAASGHWPDTFKRPNHPTFSDESIYAVGPERDRAGFWTGDNHDIYVPPANKARGGVAGFAMGGMPWSGEAQSWVPTVGGIAAGRGAPQAPSFVQAAGEDRAPGLSKDQMKGVGAIAKGASGLDWGGMFNSLGAGDGLSGDSWGGGSFGRGDAYGGSAASPLPGLSPDDYGMSRGGRIRRYANGGYAYGGSPDDEDVSFDDRFGAAFPNRVVAGVGASRPAFEDEPFRMPPKEAVDAWRAGVDRDIGKGVTEQPTGGEPAELPPEVISGRSKPPVMAAGEADEGPSDVMAYDRPRGQMRGVAPMAAAPEGVPDENFLSRMGVRMTPELKQGLLQAGLAMMATRHGGPGSFLSSLGEAGMTGVGAYNQTAQAALDQAEKMRKEAFEREKFERPYSEMTAAQRAAERRAREAADRERIPSGYRVGKDGNLEYIKGGPEDPDVAKRMAEAKRQTNQIMTDENADFLAERVLVGDTRALIGLGRGAQGAENLAKIQSLVAAKAKERGLDASDILAKAAEQSGVTAAQRTFGTQTARMAINATEAQGAIELGRAASANVPRTNWVPVNKAIQAYQSGTSDPALAKFGAANLAIINTYARAISPTGVPTVHDKEHAEKLLSTAMGPDAYLAVLDQMNEEIKIAHGAAPKAKRELEDIRKGRPTEPAKTESKEVPKKGERKQFRQGWGVWDGEKWVPE